MNSKRVTTNSDILTINGGSSSLKFALFEITAADALCLRVRGEIDHLHSVPGFQARDADHNRIAEEQWRSEDAGHEAAFKRLLLWLRQARGEDHLEGVGHRVVHGGDEFSAPVLIDEQVLLALEKYIPLAPLHQPHHLAAIRVLRNLEPELQQVACFDTAFHVSIPEVATLFALPRDYQTRGIHRYGFHGLSYEYIARELHRIAPGTAAGRVVVAHLGSGATLCAMHNGQSVDTSCGMTALEGLPMGTRCGAIDPGVLLYLMRQDHLDVSEMEQLLYEKSGLLGLSGIGANVEALLDSDDPRAMEAIEYFVYRVAREIGALASSLGGVDALVFTAGIGEHAAPIRSWICGKLRWLGLQIDEAANARDASIISAPDSRVSVRIMPTDEERMIAEHTLQVIAVPGILGPLPEHYTSALTR